MNTTKDFPPKNLTGIHSLRKRCFAGILSMCLVITSFPVKLSAQEPENTDEYSMVQQETSFSQLPEEIKEQHVAPGTPVESLNLPSALTAVKSTLSQQPVQKEDEPEPEEKTDDEIQAPDAAPADDSITDLTPLNGEENEEEPSAAPEGQPEEEPEQTDGSSEPAAEEVLTIEEFTVEGITWRSEPEYNGDADGTYVFSPVFPADCDLSGSSSQPEIIVTVGGTDSLAESEPEDDGTEVVIISANETWGARTLDNQKLIVKPGITLTLENEITADGKVVIEGGGTILRNSENARFNAKAGSMLTVKDVTLDGASIEAPYAMFMLNGAALVLDDGCRIKNCVNKKMASGDGRKGGAVHTMYSKSTIVLNHAYIENCSADQGGAIDLSQTGDSLILNNAVITGCSAIKGGAVCASNVKVDMTFNSPTIENCQADAYGGAVCVEMSRSVVHINGGTYRNNKTTEVLVNDSDNRGGGAIFTCKSTLNISGGSFIGNTTAGKGGAIHHCGHNGTETYLYGGSFEGNTCANSKYAGSGAVYRSVFEPGTNNLGLSGNAQFSGNSSAGTDGIYLDGSSTVNNGKPKEILISSTLSSPVTIYAEAVKDGFIAEGTGGYSLLDKDMKQIHYVHASNASIKLYADLRADVNKAVLTDKQPELKYYIHYIVPKDAAGTFENDNTGYNSGDTFTVTSGENLTLNGKPFTGWNASEDGLGKYYNAGVSYAMPDSDLYLYAVFASQQTEYRISFDLNGGSGTCPDMQIVPYGGYLNAVSEPALRGYSFKGWYKDAEGTEKNRWDFEKTVERNTKETSTTLYAKYVDDIPPVLGGASYNSGYTDFKGWIVRKKNLVVTVPITEEGSGVKRADYILKPETGNTFSGEAKIEEGEDLVTGEDNTPTVQPTASITIDQDFKGTISLSCVDNAENVSASRTLTAQGGGVIVEDYAPEIRFSTGKGDDGTVSVMVSVKDDVDSSGGNHITGGIAEICYQIDQKTEKTVNDKNFSESIVPFYDFTIDISSSGSHTLTVTATDRAGNQNKQDLKVKIAKKEASSPAGTGTSYHAGNTPTALSGPAPVSLSVPMQVLPVDSEPDTGDTSTRVEVYATVAMIAGLSYILLYFSTGKNGMKEEEKNELVAKWIRWAKRGRKYRRLIALAVIFCLLFYYHSIGKQVSVEWKEVYGK